MKKVRVSVTGFNAPRSFRGRYVRYGFQCETTDFDKTRQVFEIQNLHVITADFEAKF